MSSAPSRRCLDDIGRRTRRSRNLGVGCHSRENALIIYLSGGNATEATRKAFFSPEHAIVKSACSFELWSQRNLSRCVTCLSYNQVQLVGPEGPSEVELAKRPRSKYSRKAPIRLCIKCDTCPLGRKGKLASDRRETSKCGMFYIAVNSSEVASLA